MALDSFIYSIYIGRVEPRSGGVALIIPCFCHLLRINLALVITIRTRGLYV